MEKRRRRLAGLASLLALVVLAVAAARLGPRLGFDSAPGAGARAGGLEASGVIAADEVAVSSASGGRIAGMEVAEGDTVAAGQTLLTLDSALLEAQIAVGQAQVDVSQTALRQVEAGARAGAIGVAEAEFAQARVGEQAAVQALADALALRENPQQLDMQIAVGEAQLAAAEHRLKNAVALKDAAETARNLADYLKDVIQKWTYPVPPPKLPDEANSAPYDWWKSWVGVNAASASLDDLKARLAHWRAVRDNPQQLNSQVETARAALVEATAAVAVAEAQRDAYRAGASAEQLAAARARVTQARAVFDALLAQREEMVVVAPVDGVVLSRAAYAGEVAAPGATLLTLADLSEVRLDVYVAENRLGEVAIGEKVLVAVDAFPGRTFEGHIAHIADRAQYTPRNVATKEERVNTVYAVDIRLTNPERLLKPGMAADVTFGD